MKNKTSKDIINFLNEGNNIFRCGFNLFQKGLSRVEVEKRLKEYNFDFDLMDFTVRRFICQDIEAFYKSYKTRNQKTLIFGGRKNYKDYLKGLISKEDWLSKRNNKGILFVGSAKEKLGNRKVDIDVENGLINFKINKKTHFKCEVDFNKRYNDLLKIQMLAEQHQCPITYRLDDKFIYISFDEVYLKSSEHVFVKDRMVGLDLNPNFISFVVSDKEKVIYREVIDITELNKTHNKNKKDYEVIQIAKRFSKLCKHYRVEMVGYEDLTIVSKDHGKGRGLNRLINNSWNRNLFINNFKKRLNILGIQNKPVPAQYSSTIGCLNHPEETDSIAAAIEISRRCYYYKKKFLDKDKEFLDADIIYPPFDRKKIIERWNSILSDYISNKMGYKSIHEYLKKQKKLNLLRFLFKDYNFSSWSFLRNQSRKSRVVLYFSI
jgi:hypothetical protein